MRMFASGSAVLILLTSFGVAVSPEAHARAYQCFDRQTGQQIADSDVDLSTPSVNCQLSPGTTTGPQAKTNTDPLASRRAINLARGAAVSLNGGLSQYRPSECMFASALNNPCITRIDPQGIAFTIPGGPPGWEQNGEAPSVQTVVIIAPDGRSVLDASNQ